MSRTSRFAPALLVLATTIGFAPAADPAPSEVKSADKAITDSLRDIHNYGADLYNQAKDYTGAYRVYEGALKTVSPLLGHRPATQKTIDTGLAAAAAETDPARRAFLLHETIEKVRAELKGTGTASKPVEPMKLVEPKKPAEPNKKTEPKKPLPPKPKPSNKSGTVGVAGKVTYKGQPLAVGTLTLVSLDFKEPRVFGSEIKDGQFSLNRVPAGTYIVTVSAQQNGKELLPAKYSTTDTSELRVEVKDGTNTFDLDLK